MVSGELLVEDYSVTCNQGEHVGYTVLAGIFLGVYVVGIPLVMFVLMWWNRKALHNETHPKHRWVNTAFGGLFLQCKFCGRLVSISLFPFFFPCMNVF